MLQSIISHSKSAFSSLIDQVRAGESVMITDRDVNLHAGHTSSALGRLKRLAETWHEVQAGDRVKATAKRLLRTHNLRTAHALQLAAAITLGAGDASRVSFLTLDDRLRIAAEREGLHLVHSDTH